MKKLITLFLTLLPLVIHARQQTAVSDNPHMNFHGVYIGLNAGVQNVFGGSFVNDMDILAQDTRFVSEIAIGYRTPLLKNKLVLGLEFSLGFLDADLEHVDSTEPLRIQYENSAQNSLGLTAGFLLGRKKRSLLFLYANETKRKFEVAIDQPPYNFNQTDKQGMLKYGIGLEYKLFPRLGIRSTYGGLHVDFGELETNIDVEDKQDFTFGLSFQF